MPISQQSVSVLSKDQAKRCVSLAQKAHPQQRLLNKLLRLLNQLNPRKVTKMKMTKGQKKVGKVMKEFKSGTLHSGKGGKVVKSPRQAIAIALSSAGMTKKKKK